jgi:hypothetical protein
MSRDDIVYIGGIIALIVIGIIVLISPGGRVEKTGNMTSLQSPPAMNDSNAGSSTGESGRALPAQNPTKVPPSAPVQAPAQ